MNEYIKPNGLTISSIARSVGVEVLRLSEIVRGKRRLTPESAIKLAQYFENTDARYWLQLQLEYDLQLAERGMYKKRGYPKRNVKSSVCA